MKYKSNDKHLKKILEVVAEHRDGMTSGDL